MPHKYKLLDPSKMIISFENIVLFLLLLKIIVTLSVSIVVTTLLIIKVPDFETASHLLASWGPGWVQCDSQQRALTSSAGHPHHQLEMGRDRCRFQFLVSLLLPSHPLFIPCSQTYWPMISSGSQCRGLFVSSYGCLNIITDFWFPVQVIIQSMYSCFPDQTIIDPETKLQQKSRTL